MEIKEFLDSLSPEQFDAYLKESELQTLRMERNRLLAESDWMVLPDRTPTSAQLAYRQALRDITNNYSAIEGVVWPTLEEIAQ